jgi:hypothetical protein
MPHPIIVLFLPLGDWASVIECIGHELARFTSATP